MTYEAERIRVEPEILLHMKEMAEVAKILYRPERLLELEKNNKGHTDVYASIVTILRDIDRHLAMTPPNLEMFLKKSGFFGLYLKKKRVNDFVQELARFPAALE